MLGDITTTGVRQAIADYDAVGRDAILRKLRIRSLRGYSLHYGGRAYDSKGRRVGAARRLGAVALGLSLVSLPCESFGE